MIWQLQGKEKRRKHRKLDVLLSCLFVMAWLSGCRALEPVLTGETTGTEIVTYRPTALLTPPAPIEDIGQFVAEAITETWVGFEAEGYYTFENSIIIQLPSELFGTVGVSPTEVEERDILNKSVNAWYYQSGKLIELNKDALKEAVQDEAYFIEFTVRQLTTQDAQVDISVDYPASNSGMAEHWYFVKEEDKWLIDKIETYFNWD